MGNILIIDKQGDFGELLNNQLKNRGETIVLFSKARLKKIPAIPNVSYSHIFVIYQGEKDIESIITQLIEKADKDKAKFIFISSYQHLSKTEVLNTLHYSNRSVVAVIGDLVDHLLYQAAAKEKITLSNMGVRLIYPSFVKEAIEKVLELAYREKTQSRLFFLFPKNGVTELSIARILHSINPNIKIDFSKQEEKSIQKDPTFGLEGEYLLGHDYSLKKSISEGLLAMKFVDIEPKQYIKKQNRFRFNFFSLIFFILCVVLFPVIVALATSVGGGLLLKSAKNELEQGNLTASLKKAHASSKLLTISQISAPTIVLEASLIGKKEKASLYARDVDTLKKLSLLFYDGLKALQDAEKADNKKDFAASLNTLKNTLISLEALSLESGTNSELKEVLSQIKNLKATTHLFTDATPVLPNLLGFDKQQKYLLLFQNNMELRPGGGFIGSYGLLTLEKGKIIDLKIHDVYDADGQLKGHVEPPFPIRRFLPSVHLYLRDSNFDVDFSKSASTSAMLFNLETGEVVDGVVGVDVSFLQNILKSTGPIYVPDYNQTVTDEDVYMLTQTHAEKNFFPGSTQKKDFLRSLFSSLQQKIEERKSFSYFDLLKSLDTSISQKHLLFAFSDPSVQDIFTIHNASSSLWDIRTEKENVINDFLGLNEANLGVNKANYFVKRSISQEVLVGESGEVSEKVSVTYKNTQSIWPGGDYKVFVRFIMPEKAALSSILIDGQEQKTTQAITNPAVYEGKNFSPPKELEVFRQEENGKTIYGFLVTVSATSQKQIDISYTLPPVFLESENFSYSHKLFKQPGTDNDPFAFSLSYPVGFKPQNLPLEFIVKDNIVRFSTQLLEDKDFELNFYRE